MPSKSTLLIATRNAHKTAEFAAMLGDRFCVTDLRAFRDAPEVAETADTFEGNATLKAIAISRWCGERVLADDSGLEVDALGGAPGVFSARYAGAQASDEENVVKLLAALAAARELGDLGRARFRAVLVLARAGVVEHVASGAVEGRVVEAPRGHGGFGYDPIFVPDGFEQTFAELPAEVKNRISHRAAAIRALADHLGTATK